MMITLASALDPNEFKAELIVLGGADTLSSAVPKHIPLTRGTYNRVRKGLPWLVRTLRAKKPDIAVSVMGYLNLALLAAKPLLPRNTKIVVREANTVKATLDALPKPLPASKLYVGLYPRANAIVSPTQVIANEILAAAPKTADTLHVIPNPVDVDGIRSRAAPPKRRPGEGLRLIAAGRLTHQKGFDRLIELAAQFPPDAHLTIFGEGPDETDLRSRVAATSLKDRIHFGGFTRDLPAWIAGADAFLLPSRWEGLPNVVLESLALGTPAIVSDQAEVGELATKAQPGALTIKPVGPEFLHAMTSCSPRALGTNVPASSLLPETYEMEQVSKYWTAMLKTIHSAAS